MKKKLTPIALICSIGLIISSKSRGDGSAASELPMLSEAQPGSIKACTELADSFSFEKTTLTELNMVAAAEKEPEYCLVTGHMNERTSAIDNKDYAIKFEMRMPTQWNGRFLYQGNGGTDGNVAAAVGRIGSPKTNALQHGFAIISSDAGHPTRSASFGLDPQARLDYGYQAVGTLTPMAKALIESAYGRGADRSYIGGSSNGGRHTLVAASRYADHFDGYVAIAPGFNLPRAAVAQLWGAQQWAPLATEQSVPTDPDTGLATALTAAERALIASKILEACDELDGLADGMVQDIYACQSAFDLKSAMPVCIKERDGSCLSSEQLDVIADVFDGANTEDGNVFYSAWVYDPGIRQQNWADWKFKYSVNHQRDAVAYGYIFATPPNPPAKDDTLAYALALDIDEAVASISATDETYRESSLDFMTPPEPLNLDTLRAKGAKVLVTHGASDGVFSMHDTVSWYKSLDAAYEDRAEDFARLFLVPGMGHTRGGPATDQYDALMAVVNWVEKGQAPERIDANVQARNEEVISQGWPTERTRPLCLFPTVARYTGGDSESANSFTCE